MLVSDVQHHTQYLEQCGEGVGDVYEHDSYHRPVGSKVGPFDFPEAPVCLVVDDHVHPHCTATHMLLKVWLMFQCPTLPYAV